jgi:hypothetical protein
VSYNTAEILIRYLSDINLVGFHDTILLQILEDMKGETENRMCMSVPKLEPSNVLGISVSQLHCVTVLCRFQAVH